MTMLTIILFILGIGFLVLGWRWQSPQEADLLTALKGLVHLKRELEKVQGNLLALEGKVERLPGQAIDADQTLKDVINEVIKVSQSWPGEVPIQREPERAPEAIKVNPVVSETAAQSEFPLRKGETGQSQALPEKYLKVLELADSGFSLKEIARELSLSQDAVGLVLRTALRGGRA